ncbi:MAG TPA: prephenate dehydratase domain-containing protein [Candidatus Dormibacteraeota bacterium]|nr:prephenate dehydratase domain-containing protein [Candidatus Dormibacteraeota bacterium]
MRGIILPSGKTKSAQHRAAESKMGAALAGSSGKQNSTIELKSARVAFQGERGAFSEAAAIQLLGDSITTIPRPTFDSAFAAIADGAADVLLAPVENTLAGSVVRVYDLLLESDLTVVAETILHIEHQLIGCPGATQADLRSVSSHPVALAQCEKFFLAHPNLKRVPTEDTAGSVREVISRGDKSFAGIAARRAAAIYGGIILAENIHDNPENFTRFVLLVPSAQAAQLASPEANKMSIALRLAHKPGALLAALEPFSRHGVNLQKIESRPIHGRPFEYQFYLDVETNSPVALNAALAEVRSSTTFLRVLGLYPSASRS